MNESNKTNNNKKAWGKNKGYNKYKRLKDEKMTSY